MNPVTFPFQIEFTGYWHAGTGEAGAGDLDAVIIRDADGLPFLPGKSLKGLFCEAFCELIAAGDPSNGHAPREDALLRLFGRPGPDSLKNQGLLRFSNASIPPAERAALLHDKSADGLTAVIASTALEHGLAEERSLRRVEVAIPMTLHFTITLRPSPDAPSPDTVKTWLEDAAARIRMAGSHRHNGLGECKVSPAPVENLPESAGESTPAESAPADKNDDLLTLWFALETLEPVILGADAATVGEHECLDHISGAALLGAFAAQYYNTIAQLGGMAAFHVFHSGAVRFGPAYPVGPDGQPAFPAPLSWHVEKGGKLFGDDSQLLRENLLDLTRSDHPGRPVVQARREWLTASGKKITVERRTHLKSARDSALFGRPIDAKLFAYQSIAKGQRFWGAVQIRSDLVPDEAVALLREWIAGQPAVFIGRSRGAEFGQCRLMPLANPPAIPQSAPPAGPFLTLYALTDLCPPGAELLPQHGKDWHPALDGLELCPERTFVRARALCHWNGWRGCPDPAIRVIERGSVITFRAENGAAPDFSAIQAALARDGVGLHLERGLGRVLVSPDFAAAGNGSSPVLPALKAPDSAASSPKTPNTPLVERARFRAETRRIELDAANLAKELVRKWKKFSPQPSPSQWSRLRFLAASARSFEGFAKIAGAVFDHGKTKKVWSRAVHNSESLLDELLTSTTKEVDGKKVIEWAVSPELSKLVGKQSTDDKKNQRLVLLAVSEAARQLRLLARDKDTSGHTTHR